MATKLYPRPNTDGRIYSTGNNDANLRGSNVSWSSLSLATTPGSAVVNVGSTSTVAGATAGVEVGTTAIVWYSNPLDADVTISGSITWNIWAAESSNSANVAINGRIEKVDGATGAITLIDATARTTEVALTTRAVNNFSETPAAGVACKRGDRLRVRIYGDDAGTMATGFTFQVGVGGPTGGADGDTWVQVTENLTFTSEPAGSQVFLLDTASAVSTASDDREAWTSRGAGVQSAVTNTVTGWAAPTQVTASAGGTVVDWFTRPLVAFTLGGATRVNLRALESSGSANTAIRCEIARVAGDGTAATAWAQASSTAETSTSETAQSFIVSGDDLAISDGQRLRVRVLLDDLQDAASASGFTVTLFFAGTSAAASGDSYVTFTQSLTEFVIAGADQPYVNVYPPLLAQ